LDIDLERDAINERVSEVYRLKDLLVINTLMSLSVTEWLGLEPWEQQYGLKPEIKNALLYEANKVLEQRARNNREAEQKHKLEREAARPSGVEMPHSLGGIQAYLK
jgi:hypothetical protein